jgi:hypothetical protein
MPMVAEFHQVKMAFSRFSKAALGSASGETTAALIGTRPDPVQGAR